MIGFYDYTVILTYIGLLSTMLGIFQAVEGNYLFSIVCMGITLLCDTMDGRVARAKKNRTDKERLFGIQIDSLCDVISFGVAPSVLCYMLGLRGWLGCVAIGFYSLCCVIRLGYYNVLETNRAPDEKCVYHGLPVVGLATAMPAVYLVRSWLPEPASPWLLGGVMMVVGTLYILDFELKKPGVRQLIILLLVYLVPFVAICLL
jgi:CDP-diacylglycerol--serine O-phosphatidyltransferase